MQQDTTNINIDQMQTQDLESVYNLIRFNSDQGLMLYKSLTDIKLNQDEFIVASKRNDSNQREIIGCIRLYNFTPELAEIKSLAVKKRFQNLGIGKKLVLSAETKAFNKFTKRIFALTYQEKFFIMNGYKITDISTLPEKIFEECAICPFKTNCKEKAVLKEFI